MNLGRGSSIYSYKGGTRVGSDAGSVELRRWPFTVEGHGFSRAALTYCA